MRKSKVHALFGPVAQLRFGGLEEQDSDMSIDALRKIGIPPALVEGRGLVPYGEAATLEVAEVGADGREHRLCPEAAASWKAMKVAARGDGVDLFIVSAYRSVARQQEIILAKLARGASLEEVLRVSAPPGYSEHHTGRAVDIGTPGSPPLELEFAESEAFRWLMRRAREFDFVMSYPEGNTTGYAYEPWHWCHRSVAQ